MLQQHRLFQHLNPGDRYYPYVLSIVITTMTETKTMKAPTTSAVATKKTTAAAIKENV